MSSRRAWGLAAACAAGAAALVVVLLALPSSDHPVALAGPAPIEVTQTLDAHSALFGDELQAEIEIVSSRSSIEPGSVQIATDFRPYAPVATTVDRARQGTLDLTRMRITLDCLTPACVGPSAGARVFRFAPTTVRYSQEGRTRTLTQPWPQLRVGSRLQGRNDTLAEAPPVMRATPRVSPALARALLLGLAIGLATVGAWLVLTGVWPHLFSTQRRWRGLSALEQALAQLDAAGEIDDAGVRRRVLEQLATRLGEAELPALERRSRTLAWSAPIPERDDLARLGEDVRARLEGGRA